MEDEMYNLLPCKPGCPHGCSRSQMCMTWTSRVYTVILTSGGCLLMFYLYSLLSPSVRTWFPVTSTALLIFSVLPSDSKMALPSFLFKSPSWVRVWKSFKIILIGVHYHRINDVLGFILILMLFPFLCWDLHTYSWWSTSMFGGIRAHIQSLLPDCVGSCAHWEVENWVFGIWDTFMCLPQELGRPGLINVKSLCVCVCFMHMSAVSMETTISH